MSAELGTTAQPADVASRKEDAIAAAKASIPTCAAHVDAQRRLGPK